MSFVEAAIKKIQHSRDGAAEHQQPAPVAADRAASAPAKGEEFSGNSGKKIHIDREMLRSRGMLAPVFQEHRVADEYRQIKRPLIARAIGRGVPKAPNGRVILVASAKSGEGKTFTSVNLALSMAVEQDLSVLLVDADVAKPHISRMFGLAEEPGLLDALQQGGPGVQSLVVQTDVPRLSVLPAGRQIREMATELLSSTRMEQLLERLGQGDPRCMVIIDSPPLLAASESQALIQIAGQIVLVVKAGDTPQQTVLDAVSYLGKDKLIGVVLNQGEGQSPSGYYGYDSGGQMP